MKFSQFEDILVLFVLLLGAHRVVDAFQLIRDDVLTDHTIDVDKVGAGFRDGRLTHIRRVLNAQCQRVFIIVLLHVRAGRPLAPIFAIRVILDGDSEDSLLHVGRVDGEDAHQDEIGCDTDDQNWSED